MSWYRLHPASGTLTLTLHVQPNAKRTEPTGLHGEALKMRVASPPVEGAANEALVGYLAKVFRVPARQVVLRHGGQSRHKVVEIQGSGVPPEVLWPGSTV